MTVRLGTEQRDTRLEFRIRRDLSLHRLEQRRSEPGHEQPDGRDQVFSRKDASSDFRKPKVSRLCVFAREDFLTEMTKPPVLS
jgi:hypothetical protein